MEISLKQHPEKACAINLIPVGSWQLTVGSRISQPKSRDSVTLSGKQLIHQAEAAPRFMTGQKAETPSRFPASNSSRKQRLRHALWQASKQRLRHALWQARKQRLRHTFRQATQQLN